MCSKFGVAAAEGERGRSWRHSSVRVPCRRDQVWARKLAGGDEWFVALVNRDLANAQNVAVNFTSIGLADGATAHLRDLFDHVDLNDVTGPVFTLPVAPGGTRAVKLSKA